MQDIFSTILVLLRNAWRLRWTGIATAWAVALAGWLAVAAIPNIYEAHSRIYVDVESVLRPLLSGLAVGTDASAEAASVSRLLVSRPSLQKVAEETNLLARAENESDKQRIVDSLSQRIVIMKAVSDPNLYTVSFADRDPVMAQRVVDKLINTFVGDTLGLERDDNSQAQDFLVGQIREYEVRLRAAEERVAEFKRTNIGLMPGQSGDYYQRLQAALTELQAVQAEYRMASSKRDELLRQLEGEEPTVGLGGGDDPSSSVPSSVDSQISAAKAQLAPLLLQYTEKHPEVVVLKDQIKRLEAERAAQIAARSRGGFATSAGTNPLNINPVYQSMRIGLSQAELQLVDSRNRLGRAQSEVGKLRGMVNTLPEVESELTRLNRDYEVTRAQHQQLLQRLETARITQSAEASKEGTRFRIVEPARVPTVPAGPMRNVFNLAALLFALGAGLAVALVASKFVPVFSTRKELQSALGLPIFGSVSFAPNADLAAEHRRQPRLALLAIGLLIAAYAGTILLTRWLNSSLTPGV